MNNNNIAPYNRYSNPHVNVASPPTVTFEEYSDGPVFCRIPPDLSNEQFEAIYNPAKQIYPKHLLAAMIGQWVYGREKMIEVYAAMKQIKAETIYAYNLQDFRNEREGWYNLFERNAFDKEKCFKSMQEIHQMYVDIDNSNRTPQIHTNSNLLPINLVFIQANPPVYSNNTNNNNNVDLENIVKPPRKRQKTQANKDIDINLNNNSTERNRTNQIGINTINRLPNNQPQPNFNFDLLTPKLAFLQANQPVDNNNNNNVDFDEVKKPSRKKQKAQQNTLHYKYTDENLTKENASIYRSVYKNGVYGIINGIENNYNSDQIWISIKWDDGRFEKVLSTPFCLKDIYLTSLRQ